MERKWEKFQIERLLEAYKKEPCLYSMKHPNHRNKQVRNKALHRVVLSVNEVRPGTDAFECSRKIHSLRNSFNVENKKVMEWVKKGPDQGDVYVPALWYYNKLKFLEENIMPRKSFSFLPFPNLLQDGSVNDPMDICKPEIKFEDDSADEFDMYSGEPPDLSSASTSTTSTLASSRAAELIDSDYHPEPATAVRTDISSPPSTPAAPSGSVSPNRPPSSVSASPSPSLSRSLSPHLSGKPQHKINEPVVFLPQRETPREKDQIDLGMDFVGSLVKTIPAGKERDTLMLDIIKLVMKRKEELDPSQ